MDTEDIEDQFIREHGDSVYPNWEAIFEELCATDEFIVAIGDYDEVRKQVFRHFPWVKQCYSHENNVYTKLKNAYHEWLVDVTYNQERRHLSEAWSLKIEELESLYREMTYLAYIEGGLLVVLSVLTCLEIAT